MKICILSMQRVANFGSLLQSYSLKKVLEDMGHNVSFLDIEKRPEDDCLLGDARKGFSIEYGKRKWLPAFLNGDFLHKVLTRGASKRQSRLMQQFQDDILCLTEDANCQHYDCCIIGSDEVFNALNATEWGFTSQLFGNVLQADRVITYAASCGFTSYGEIPESAIDVIRRSFRYIRHFSVRDSNTLEFVKQFTDTPVQIHCDPVVIGDFSAEVSHEPTIKGLPQNYCIVYAYHDRINREEEIHAIKALCKEKGMEIVSVGASQAWIGRHVAASPFQIPKLFSNASFVITDTFHGAIFAAKYSRRLAIIVRPSNANKLTDLLNTLEIKAHRVESMTQLWDIYELEHDLLRTHEIEEMEKERTIRYFKTVLNG